MIIDARGLICPLPVLKLRKVLLTLPSEAVVSIDVTDKNALKDIPLFCAESGDVVLSFEPFESFYRLSIQKK